MGVSHRTPKLYIGISHVQFGSGVSITLAYPSDNDDDAALNFIGSHDDLVQAYFEPDLVSCREANVSLREEIRQLKTLLSQSEQKNTTQVEVHKKSIADYQEALRISKGELHDLIATKGIPQSKAEWDIIIQIYINKIVLGAHSYIASLPNHESVFDIDYLLKHFDMDAWISGMTTINNNDDDSGLLLELIQNVAKTLREAFVLPTLDPVSPRMSLTLTSHCILSALYSYCNDAFVNPVVLIFQVWMAFTASSPRIESLIHKMLAGSVSKTWLEGHITESVKQDKKSHLEEGHRGLKTLVGDNCQDNRSSNNAFGTMITSVFNNQYSTTASSIGGKDISKFAVNKPGNFMKMNPVAACNRELFVHGSECYEIVEGHSDIMEQIRIDRLEEIIKEGPVITPNIERIDSNCNSSRTNCALMDEEGSSNSTVNGTPGNNGILEVEARTNIWDDGPKICPTELNGCGAGHANKYSKCQSLVCKERQENKISVKLVSTQKFASSITKTNYAVKGDYIRRNTNSFTVLTSGGNGTIKRSQVVDESSLHRPRNLTVQNTGTITPGVHIDMQQLRNEPVFHANPNNIPTKAAILTK